MRHKERLAAERWPAGSWTLFVFAWIYQSQVSVSAGRGVSLCLALSWIRTYSDASGLSGPACPNYRCLLYIKHSAWFFLSAALMIALSSLMTAHRPQITLTRAAAWHGEEGALTYSKTLVSFCGVQALAAVIWCVFGWGFTSILECDPHPSVEYGMVLHQW